MEKTNSICIPGVGGKTLSVYLDTHEPTDPFVYAVITDRVETSKAIVIEDFTLIKDLAETLTSIWQQLVATRDMNPKKERK